jgi:hypothetical protein
LTPQTNPLESIVWLSRQSTFMVRKTRGYSPRPVTSRNSRFAQVNSHRGIWIRWQRLTANGTD